MIIKSDNIFGPLFITSQNLGHFRVEFRLLSNQISNRSTGPAVHESNILQAATFFCHKDCDMHYADFTTARVLCIFSARKRETIKFN